MLCLVVRRLSPSMAACTSLAPVGTLMAFWTAVPTVISLSSWLHNAAASCAPRRLPVNNSSSLSPSRLR